MRQAAIVALITLAMLNSAEATEQGHHANSVSAFLGVTGEGDAIGKRANVTGCNWRLII